MNWKSHKPCPYEDCGSTDAFSYNLDSMSGRCHSCERKYPRDKAAKLDWAEEEYPTQGQQQQEKDRQMDCRGGMRHEALLHCTDIKKYNRNA